MRGFDASTYGERWVDVYDDWYDDPDEVAATVAFLADLAGPPADLAGPIVELGIGTGRVALPLAARGYDVRGIDASEPMVERLRAKPGGDTLPVTIGDMAAVEVPGETGATGATCRGVFVAYNTFFNLTTDDAQRTCVRHVAERLTPGGWFVVAAFVPDAGSDRRSSDVGVRSIDADRVVLTADLHDPDSQTIRGQFVDITTAGIALRPFFVRYLFPEQLDALAADAGLTLAQRWATWSREPFDDHSPAHVSVYRRDG